MLTCFFLGFANLTIILRIILSGFLGNLLAQKTHVQALSQENVFNMHKSPPLRQKRLI